MRKTGLKTNSIKEMAILCCSGHRRSSGSRSFVTSGFGEEMCL